MEESMKKTLILMMVGIIIAGFTLGCCNPERFAERIVEKAIEAEGGDDVDIDIGGKIPADVPKELVYPGSKVEASMTMSSAEGEGSTLVLSSKSSISRVVLYYKGLKKKGWEIQMEMFGSSDDGEGGMLALVKGSFGAVVTIGEDDGKTSILIIYGEELNQ